MVKAVGRASKNTPIFVLSPDLFSVSLWSEQRQHHVRFIPHRNIIWNSVFGYHILTVFIWLSMIPFEVLCWVIQLNLFSSLSLTILSLKIPSDKLSLNQYYQKRMNISQVINLQLSKTIKKERTFWKISILTKLNQEDLSLVRLVSQWFDSVFYTSVFKFPPCIGPILHVV